MRTEVLAGLVVALALSPEAISFSILAGVDPKIGLFAPFTMAVTIASTSMAGQGRRDPVARRTRRVRV